MKIITSSGKIVHQTEARALNYTYEDTGADGVQRMLETLVSSESQINALEAYDYVMTEEHGYYEVNSAAMTRVKDNQSPLFCHRAGKSYSNCYVYLDGGSILVYSSGS